MWGLAALLPARMPIRTVFPACCASAASGARMPPITLPMNVRRSITDSPDATNAMPRNAMSRRSSVQSRRDYDGLAPDALVNDCYRAQCAMAALGPRAAVPNVRAKQTMDKLRISAKGCFAAPAPTGSRRPGLILPTFRGQFQEGTIALGGRFHGTQGTQALHPRIQA